MQLSRIRAAILLGVLVAGPLITLGCGKTIGDTIDDATISTRVKSALLNEPNVAATRIEVTTAAGVVTLSGPVRSKAEEDRALAVARQVPGVKDVKSALKIE